MQANTLTVMKAKGFVGGSCPVTRVVAPNLTKSFEGFHISYNASVQGYGCATTAMVLKGRVFFVLNGNHCEDWVDATNASGIQGGVDYFVSKLAEANGYSEHGMAVGIGSDPFSLQGTTLEVLGQANVDRIAEAVRGRVAGFAA